MNDDDLALYVGGGRLFAARGRAFCWPGFVFPAMWFLYRKLYLWAAVVTAGPMLLGFIAPPAVLGVGVSILGALGHRLYFRQAERDIACIRGQRLSEEDASARIARAGGVSRVGAGLGLVYAFAAFVLALKSGMK